MPEPSERKIQEQVKRESGNRCAKCGGNKALHIAHIVPAQEGGQYTPDNLVCLCSDCHTQSHSEKWSAKQIGMFKEDPWAKRVAPESEGRPGSTTRITLQIDLPEGSLDQKRLQTLIATVVAIARDKVRIIELREGSMKATIELPTWAADELEADYEAHDQRLLRVLPLVDLRRETVTSESDEALMVEIGRGSRAAFEELFRRNYGPFLGFCIDRLHDRQLAEDACQKAWTGLLQKPGSFKPDLPFKPFFRGVCANACCDIIRKHRPQWLRKGEKKTAEEGEALRDERALDPLETLVKEEDRQRLWAAVRELRPEFRTVIELHYREGLSVHQIAEKLGVPEGLVYTWLSRARTQLRQTLGGATAGEQKP